MIWFYIVHMTINSRYQPRLCLYSGGQVSTSKNMCKCSAKHAINMSVMLEMDIVFFRFVFSDRELPIRRN